MRPTLLATLGEQQLLVGPGVMHQLHMVKVVFTVPVEARAPDVPGRVGVGIDNGGPLNHRVPVVVPDDDLDVPQPGFGQLGAKLVAHEVTLLLGAVQARIPGLACGGLVLHRHPPDRHALRFIRLDEAHKTARPGIGKLRQQMAALVHLAIALHPGGRAPGRHQQLERRAGHRLRRLDERQQRLVVAGNREVRQRRIPWHVGMGIVAERKITTVHVHTAEGVAVADGRIS